MNAAINELVKSIVKKNSLSECSVSELQRLTTQYPYFGPVQFLLAQKLKEDSSPLYPKQSQKAILYFHDQLWFDYLSGANSNTAAITSGIQDTVSVEPIKAEETTLAQEEITAPVEQQQPISNTYTEPVVEPSEIELTEEKSTATPEQEEPINNVYTEPVAEPLEPETIIAAEEEKITAPIEPEDVVNDVYAGTSPAVVEKEIAVAEEKLIEPIVSERFDDAHEEQESEIKEGEHLPPLPAFKIEPMNADAAKLTFEPYHTIDYFASQGIRFKEEEKPKNRFDQQLKSFTEWLKSMKKLPDAEIATAPAIPEDKNVTKMAEHSIVDREVVTEAMADVWEKQGNHEKAIETYRKLSLLNPAKSAYFAAKIEHLKHP